MRILLFWLHLIAGSIAGVVILIMAATGVLMTYERQVIGWADAGYRIDHPIPGAIHLPAESLLSRVREERRGVPTNLLMRSDPAAPAEVAFGRAGTVLVNPYTGTILGQSSPRARGFFRGVEDWHRWLGRQGESRAAGRTVTGVCNLAFLLLVPSGLYLWLPKKWTWQHVRPALWFRSGLGGRARDWNWHNTIGFWCAMPLLFVAGSGVVMSFPWATNLLYRITGTEPPAARAPEQSRAGPRKSTEAALPVGVVNRLWLTAERQLTGWRSISLRLPERMGSPAVFTIDESEGGHPDKRSQLTLSSADGAVIRWEPFSSYNTGRRLRAWARYAHTGEAAGVLGQTIAGVASAGAALLVWTGLWLALRRLRGWWARKSAPVTVSHV